MANNKSNNTDFSDWVNANAVIIGTIIGVLFIGAVAWNIFGSIIVSTLSALHIL